jgi:hypothetical protein
VKISSSNVSKSLARCRAFYAWDDQEPLQPPLPLLSWYTTIAWRPDLGKPSTPPTRMRITQLIALLLLQR